MTQLTQLPGSEATILYVNNLQLSNSATTPNTQLVIAAGAARDSNNKMDIIVPNPLTLNAAATGVNGLDTGTLTASKTYAVHVIDDSTNTNNAASLLSLSATAPVLPFGYDSFRRIGWAVTDGSAHFLLFWVAGNGGYRVVYWDSMISVLSAGTATSFTAITLTNTTPVVDNTPVLFYASYTPATAGNKASFRPTGSSATTVFDITGDVAAKAQDLQIKMMTKLAGGVPQMDYKVASGSDSLSLSVLGYEDYL